MRIYPSQSSTRHMYVSNAAITRRWHRRRDWTLGLWAGMMLLVAVVLHWSSADRATVLLHVFITGMITLSYREISLLRWARQFALPQIERRDPWNRPDPTPNDNPDID